MAKLYFTYGAMNCGKSTSLLQVAHNYEERGMSVTLLKPAIDTKGGDTVVSRLGMSRSVDYLLATDTNPYDLLATNASHPDCVLVDEAQFLTRQQVDSLHRYAHIMDIPVMCFGLRTDFRGNGFTGSTRLLLVADEIREMKTICSCGRKATCNVRYVNGSPTFEGEQMRIDGSETDVRYVAVCADCYYMLCGKSPVRNGRCHGTDSSGVSSRHMPSLD